MCVSLSLSVLLFLSNSRCTLQTRNPSAPQKCPVTLYTLTQAHDALKKPLSHPPLLLTPPSIFFFSFLSFWPAPPSRRAERTGGRAEPSGADNWIGVEAELPAAAATAASSGKLPAPPPTSLAHNHRTHTEPLIGRDRCRRCFRNHTTETSVALQRWCQGKEKERGNDIKSRLHSDGAWSALPSLPQRLTHLKPPHGHPHSHRMQYEKYVWNPEKCAVSDCFALEQSNLTKAVLTDFGPTIPLPEMRSQRLNDSKP